ncbi:MAG: Fur family transcriptional regulator [Breznakia sp.]
MRLTKHRKQILQLFQEEDDNLWSAETIYQKLRKQKIDLSTIYRTLEIFTREGLLHKRILEHTAYYCLQKKQHHHDMICVSCYRRFKIKCYFDDFIQDVRLQDDFQATHHDITIYGHCALCNAKKI